MTYKGFTTDEMINWWVDFGIKEAKSFIFWREIEGEENTGLFMRGKHTIVSVYKGSLHNESGPAIITIPIENSMSKDIKFIHRGYYLNNNLLKDNDFRKKLIATKERKKEKRRKNDWSN